MEKPLIVSPSLPESVELSILKKDDTVSIHFVNYQYSLETDGFRKTDKTHILIDAAATGKIDNIIFLSPDHMEQLEFSYEGQYVNITLPSLLYWGIVVINKPETVFPSEFEVSNLNLSSNTIKVGQATTISVSVKNSSGETGSCELTFKINGQAVETRTVTLDPGQSTIVSFTYVPEKEGTYSININGLTGNLTVIKKETTRVAPETLWLVIGVIVIATLAVLFLRRKSRHAPKCKTVLKTI
ncbi:MAG: CARDB domain-containing protein [Thermoproteota archaeon]